MLTPRKYRSEAVRHEYNRRSEETRRKREDARAASVRVENKSPLAPPSEEILSEGVPVNDRSSSSDGTTEGLAGA